MIYGSKFLTDEQVHKIELVRPDGAGSYWQGVRHGELLDTVHDEALGRGWEVSGGRFTVSADGADMAGSIDLRVPGVDMPEGLDLQLGFLTSNAMRRTLKLVVGARVACCLNGMASGEIVLARKHTRGLDLGAAVEGAFGLYLSAAQRIPTQVAALRELALTGPAAEHALCEAGRAGIMPWSRLGQVDAEYRKPRFAEHGTGTAWALLQAFTYVVKKNPPLEQMDQMNRFRELLVATAA